MQIYNSNISERAYKAYGNFISELEHFVLSPGECLRESYNFYTRNEKIKKDIASLVAAVSITNPLYARIETTVGRLPVIVSIKSRLISTATGYAMVALGMEGRHRLRGKMGLSHQSSFLRKTLFDLGYVAGIIFPLRMITYWVSGEHELGKILLNAGIMTGLGTAIGVPMLKIIDGYKELIGIEETNTLPKALKRKPLKFRRKLAVAYAAIGLAATVSMYIISPRHSDKKIPQGQETCQQALSQEISSKAGQLTVDYPQEDRNP